MRVRQARPHVKTEQAAPPEDTRAAVPVADALCTLAGLWGEEGGLKEVFSF